MDPLTIGLIIAGFLGTGAVLYVLRCAIIRVNYEIRQFFDGFRRRSKALQFAKEHPDFAYVTYMNEIKKGEFSMYAALLHKPTQQCIGAHEAISPQLDGPLLNAHLRSPLCVHQDW